MNDNEKQNPASNGVDSTDGSAYDDETRMSRIIENPALFDAAQKSVGINETFGREHIDCVLRSMDEVQEKRRMATRQRLLEERANIDRQLLKLDMALPNVEIRHANPNTNTAPSGQ